MARKPARLERVGHLTPRDRMWAAIRALSGAGFTWSAVEVQYLANLRGGEINIKSVLSYVHALSRAEPAYVALYSPKEGAGRHRSELWLWRLTRDTGVEAPNLTKEGKPSVQAQGTVQMWVAIKALREFNTFELAQAASTPDFAVKPGVARNYLRSLAAAGYIVAVGKLKSGVRYRFNRAKNTGPRPPIVSSDQSVVDANTGATVWPAAGNNKGEPGCRTRT